MPLNIPSKSQDTQVFVADWAKKRIEDEHGVIFKFFKILKFKANCKNYLLFLVTLVMYIFIHSK